jgi:hypothetical protein
MMENYVCFCTYALFDLRDSCCGSLWNVTCGCSPDQFSYTRSTISVLDNERSVELKNG